MHEFDLHGNQCIGQMNGGSVYNTIINDNLNKIPFEIPERGIIFYSLRYPKIRELFAKSVFFYYLLILSLIILIFPLLSIGYEKSITSSFLVLLPMILFFFYQGLTQKNILQKNGIILSSGNPIFFDEIRKIKKDKLNLKIYLKKEVYAKYVIGLKNEDQSDAVIECFENWLLSKRDENGNNKS